MSLDPSSFSPEMKKIILDNLRHEMGDSEYRSMVNKIGEDGMIRLFIEQLNSQGPEATQSTDSVPTYRRSWKTKLKKVLLHVFVILGILIFFIIVNKLMDSDNKILAAIGGILLIIYLIWMFLFG